MLIMSKAGINRVCISDLIPLLQLTSKTNYRVLKKTNTGGVECRMKKLRILFIGILLLCFAPSCFAQSSPTDIIFTNLDIIELSTQNLENSLTALQDKLKTTEQQLNFLLNDYQMLTLNLKESQENLVLISQNLQQVSEKCKQLETQLSELENKLLFWKITAGVLAGSTTVLLVLSLLN